MRLRTVVVAAMMMSIVVSLSGAPSLGTEEGELAVMPGWHAPTGEDDDTEGDDTGVTLPVPFTEPAEDRPYLGASVAVDVDGYLTWALRYRDTGAMISSSDRTNTTESMIKPWIVADHLRRTAEAGREPTAAELEQGRRAIRDSDDLAAESLYRANGTDAVVQRMIDICGLTDTTIFPGWWSRTELTAVDAVRMGECLASGAAAGPEWTDWVLEEMRNVRGTTDPADQRGQEGFEGGRWGIIDGLPPTIPDDRVAIKNGWTRIGATGSWHLNCLAVHEDWVMSVLMRYPASYSLDYGADRCARVAAQLFARPSIPPS